MDMVDGGQTPVILHTGGGLRQVHSPGHDPLGRKQVSRGAAPFIERDVNNAGDAVTAGSSSPLKISGSGSRHRTPSSPMKGTTVHADHEAGEVSADPNQPREPSDLMEGTERRGPDSRRFVGSPSPAPSGGTILSHKQSHAVGGPPDVGLEGMMLVRGIQSLGEQERVDRFIHQPQHTMRHKHRKGVSARINFRSMFGPPAHTGGGTLVPAKVKEGLRRRREAAMLMAHGVPPFKRGPQPPRPETPEGIKLDGQFVIYVPRLIGSSC